MTKKPGLSPAARSIARPGQLGWGIALAAVGLFFLFLALTGASAATALSVILLLIGLPLLANGWIKLTRARAYNRADLALAETISQELNELCQRPEIEAYLPDAGSASVNEATVVELERHFDQETAGSIIGTLNHRFSTFGHSTGFSGGGISNSGLLSAVNNSSMRGFINGVSSASLRMNQTTSANLLGDALFSVLEFTSATGHKDTMRVVSVSAPAASSWIADLIAGVGHALGGTSTHAGSSVGQWIGPLTNKFTPRDISYTTDRLKALERSSDLTRISVTGQTVGRNAILGTQFRFADGQQTNLFPAQFPQMLGTAIGQATRRAVQQIDTPPLELPSAG